MLPNGEDVRRHLKMLPLFIFYNDFLMKVMRNTIAYIYEDKTMCIKGT